MVWRIDDDISLNNFVGFIVVFRFEVVGIFYSITYSGNSFVTMELVSRVPNRNHPLCRRSGCCKDFCDLKLNTRVPH